MTEEEIRWQKMTKPEIIDDLYDIYYWAGVLNMLPRQPGSSLELLEQENPGILAYWVREAIEYQVGLAFKNVAPGQSPVKQDIKVKIKGTLRRYVANPILAPKFDAEKDIAVNLFPDKGGRKKKRKSKSRKSKKKSKKKRKSKKKSRRTRRKQK